MTPKQITEKIAEGLERKGWRIRGSNSHGDTFAELLEVVESLDLTAAPKVEEFADFDWLTWMGFHSIDYPTSKIQRFQSPYGSDGSSLQFKMYFDANGEPELEPFEFTANIAREGMLPIRTKEQVRNWLRLHGVTVRDDHDFQIGSRWTAAVKKTGRRVTVTAMVSAIDRQQLRFDAGEYMEGQRDYELNELWDFYPVAPVPVVEGTVTK